MIRLLKLLPHEEDTDDNEVDSGRQGDEHHEGDPHDTVCSFGVRDWVASIEEVDVVVVPEVYGNQLHRWLCTEGFHFAEMEDFGAENITLFFARLNCLTISNKWDGFD